MDDSVCAECGTEIEDSSVCNGLCTDCYWASVDAEDEVD